MSRLLEKGYTHVMSNFYCRYGEIDLVMMFHGKLHFIEVKSVSRENFIKNMALNKTGAGVCGVIDGNPEAKNVIRETGYRPEDNVSPRKVKRLIKTIQVFMEKNDSWDSNWQFDIYVVYIDRQNKKAYTRPIRDIILGA